MGTGSVYDFAEEWKARIYDGEYPLTGILKCPQCGAGMVISRTTNRNKDGSKQKLTYYACGNWKNNFMFSVCNNRIGIDIVPSFFIPVSPYVITHLPNIYRICLCQVLHKKIIYLFRLTYAYSASLSK